MRYGVETQDLCKEFALTRWRRLRRTVTRIAAVDGISLSVAAGESVAFIGPNGAGKSTTIKMLTGILHPTSGQATVLGLTPWQDRRRLTRQIGAVFGQRSQLWYHLPPSDTFELLARIYSLERADYVKTRDMLVDRFALGPFLDVPVRKLSLGQRMRAEVASSLLHRPRVLFLDEPTIGLDVIARQQLRDLIRDWNRREGVTVFLTSHDAGDIEHVAERVVVINHGAVVVDDRVSAVRNRYLGERIVRVRFEQPPQPIDGPGVTVLDRCGYELRLLVDTRIMPVDRAIGGVLRAGPVADIAIEEPPLEQVLARIYGEARKGGDSCVG